MSSAFHRRLPARPDLDQQRKLARELLRDFRRGDEASIARIRAELPDRPRVSLTDAQFVLAREYGFASWRELREEIARRLARQQPPIEQFRRAVHEGDAAAVRRLLRQHGDVRAAIDAPIFSFDSPALVAVRESHLDVIDVLLEFGADPNRKSNWWAGGFHPLYTKRGAAAERLIAAGATMDACAATHLDRVDVLATLIAADPGRVHERGGDGQTPLHFAQSGTAVDLLLEAGADPDARDLDHRATAAEWMIGTGAGSRSHLARHLVERGASADLFLAAALGLADHARTMLEADRSLLRLRTSQGDYGEKPPSSYHIYQWTIGPNLTPLQVAARFGQRDTLAVMQRFASPVEQLLLACHEGDAAAARALVAKHPGLVEQLTPPDSQALADAAWNANAPAVAVMLEVGFDPRVPSGQRLTGGTALHNAAWQGAVACVDAILRHPAAQTLVTARDATFRGTPLGWCCHGSLNCGDPHADHAAVARALIQAGASVAPEQSDWHCSDAVQGVIEDALDPA